MFSDFPCSIRLRKKQATVIIGQGIVYAKRNNRYGAANAKRFHRCRKLLRN